MKNLITALIILSAFSSLAESYRCSSDEGEIFLDVDTYNQKVTMDLAQYRSSRSHDYDYLAHLKTLDSIELVIQELKKPYDVKEIVTNNDRFLKIHLGTPAEWVYWTLKMKLNKKKQKLTIKSFSSFIFRSKDHKDKLDCEQL